MPAKILHQVKIHYKFDTRTVWTLCGRFFTTDGVKFELVGTEITGDGSYDAIDTVKNIEKGTYADISRSKLISILMQSE